MIYFGTRLSENISRREPEGYLICLNVPVARTGTQEYLPSELGLAWTDARMIPVYRPEEEVFSPACIASFEGMPVTDDHPSAPDGVNAENIRFLQKGHSFPRYGAMKLSLFIEKIAVSACSGQSQHKLPLINGVYQQPVGLHMTFAESVIVSRKRMIKILFVQGLFGEQGVDDICQKIHVLPLLFHPLVVFFESAGWL